jgi:natural product precursor
MKKLSKITLKSISEDKLNNQEMKHIFGGTYGDPYGDDQYGGGYAGEKKCSPNANPCSGTCTVQVGSDILDGTCQLSGDVYGLCGCIV